MAALKPVLLLLFATGQAGPPADGGKPELAAPYVDGTLGLSIQPPKGWQLISQREEEPRSLVLLRMIERVSPSLEQSIVLSRTSTPRAMPMEQMLKRTLTDLQLAYSDLQVLSQQVQEIAGRPGAVLAAEFFREGLKQLRLQAIIETAPQDYYELVYSGPADLRKQSEPLFYLVLNSFQFLGDEREQAELKSALGAGMNWLAGIDGAKIEKKLAPDQLLEVKEHNEIVGVIRIQQAVHTWRGYEGVRVQERGWTFEPNGYARRLQTIMFVSKDLKHERWKRSVTTLIPAEGEKPERIENAWEEGLREGNVLLTNQTYRLGEPPQQNPALELPKTYISRALVRLLPQSVDDLSKPQKLAFTVFDHQRVDLVVRTVEMMGESERPPGVGKGKVYRIDEREGFSKAPSTVYVDEAGKVVMVQAGDVTMTPADGKALESRFASRIGAAEETMNRLEKRYQEDQERFRRPSGESKPLRPNSPDEAGTDSGRTR